MALYIGTNYHPHDWPQERWSEDVRLMKEAGFTTVRLGHLCWDSYEPEEGVYTFAWFDRVMDLFAEAGIGVVLDVSMRPAPNWLHKLCPGCQIYDKSGAPVDSLTRYMEDVDDPAYQFYALRFAKVLVDRYKDHPALFAFDLCNEQGAGKMSFSPYAKKRFQNWLKKKYGSIEALNEAWATQRWSRSYSEFSDIPLQENSISIGPPEAWLDMRRFFSDGIGSFMGKLKTTVEQEAPGVKHSSNHYEGYKGHGFDYLKFVDSFVDYPGMGLYPMYEEGYSAKWRSTMLTYMQRIAETEKPMWLLEAQTGSFGEMFGMYGINRMHAFLGLIYRVEMILGWTWRSMLGGEEQYLYGLLGHDGYKTPNYEEYKQIASDFKKLSGYAFPYLPKPQIAIAYNQENIMVTEYRAAQYRQTYEEALMQTVEYFDLENLDYNIMDLRNLKGNYQVLLVPNYILMNEAAAETIRHFVKEGGTVVMTGYSAMLDETGKVFSTPRPGNLTDVFGLRVDYFTRNVADSFLIQGPTFSCECAGDYREGLELYTAKKFATFANGDCAIAENHFGKGKAYYIATDSRSEVIGLLMRELGIENEIHMPENIRFRKIAEGQYFYVNMTSKAVEIDLAEDGYGVLSDRRYQGKLLLKGLEAELIVA